MVTKSTCVVLEGVGATSQPIDSADQRKLKSLRILFWILWCPIIFDLNQASIYVNLLYFSRSVILTASAFRCFAKRQQGEKKKTLI